MQCVLFIDLQSTLSNKWNSKLIFHMNFKPKSKTNDCIHNYINVIKNCHKLFDCIHCFTAINNFTRESHFDSEVIHHLNGFLG